DRLYRFLLRLFPAEFRGDFGADMAADFRDERRAAAAAGPRALARLWWRTVPGLFAAAVRAWAEDFAHDARFALRTMRRAPGFPAAAVVLLALGTGANAAVFSVVDAIFFRSPFPDPGRLVIVLEKIGRRHEASAGIPTTHLTRIASLPFLASSAAFTL